MFWEKNSKIGDKMEVKTFYLFIFLGQFLGKNQENKVELS